MGNDLKNKHPRFQRDQWQIIEKNPNNTLWLNRSDKNLHIEQYDIFTRDDEELRKSRQTFQLRYRHEQLVASMYYQQKNQQEFCAMSHQYSLFLQKIPIRLIDIEHIPFPDCLHLYHQALKGFALIGTVYGYFEVEQEYIGVNEKGVVKVWMNRDFSRSYMVGSRISEQQMVKGLIDIIDSNCDTTKLQGRPTIRNYLYRNSDQLFFGEAIRQFHQYTRQYNEGYIPHKLDCIDRVGGIYKIANRESGIDERENEYNRNGQYFTRQSVEYNKPRLSSEVEIQQPKMMVFPPMQYQQPSKVVYQPNNNGNFGLKSSQVVAQFKKQTSVRHPNVVRQDMEIVRRRSQYENQNMHFVDKKQIQPMKYSQNIGQTAKNNQYYSSTVNGPIISFTVSPKKQQPTQLQQTVPSRQVQQVPVHYPVAETAVQNRQSSQSNNHTVTFKALNQSIQDHNHIQLNMHNTSFANMSSNTSQPNTNRRQKINEMESISEEKYFKKNEKRHSRTQSQGFKFENETFKKSEIKPQYQVGEIRKQSIPQYQSRIESVDAGQQQLNESPERPRNSDPSVRTQSRHESYKSYEQPYNNKSISLEDRINDTSYQYGSKVSKYESQLSGSYQNQLEAEKYNEFKGSGENRSKKYDISADDGKSSEQFLKQLKQIKSSMHQNIEPESKNSAFTPTYTTQTYDQRKSNNFYTAGQKNKYDPMFVHNPLITANTFVDDQDFGRNTVSNIIETQDSPAKNNYLLARSNTPLMFEKNLEMKYSMLGEDEVPPQTSSRSYENMDADILADLKKMQS